MDEYTQRHFQQYLRSKMEEERRLGATVQGQGVIEKDSEKDELTPVLYDVSHPEYHLKDKRRNAIQRIVSALEDLEVNPMPSHDEVTKKISSLRGYFVSEKNKVNQAKVSGAGANEAYKTKPQ
eukprot:Seg2686.13 transcript_id=Seg2686.13/GoldUCD/mRNA.D3Y31 product="hypothetical protein" protein_id=Seg2686.13/GoldUCD/D3Y31